MPNIFSPVHALPNAWHPNHSKSAFKAIARKKQDESNQLPCVIFLFRLICVICGIL